MDYFIQLPPDRFELLSNGVAFAGHFNSQVTDIRRIYVFVGDDPLQRLLDTDDPDNHRGPQSLLQGRPDRGRQRELRQTTGGISRVEQPTSATSEGRANSDTNGETPKHYQIELRLVEPGPDGQKTHRFTASAGDSRGERRGC